VANQLGIAGRVRNDASGVVIDAFAGEQALQAFRERLRSAPAPAAVQTLTFREIPPEITSGFSIVGSTSAAQRRISIPPDLAICDECAREIADSHDRRFRYAFTNCTRCGPRFTIAKDVPYDRAATTMATFRLCGQCAREYTDPADRRFHAEPDACPRCGPRLEALDPLGGEIPGDPLATAVEALLDGEIVAVKGVGGFHLACDATSDEAVRRLRERKRREEKPFAVITLDLRAARELAELTPDEERLLTSPEAPIVLVRRRAECAIAPSVAPRNPLLGLLLAYTPLHRLLLAAADRPLVMTSGNLAEEPIACDDDEALRKLRGIADLFLVHDRKIAARCDDSVARVIAGKPVVLRRSRGWVPRPVRLARPVARPVLAAGGHLKNTFCLAVDDMAVLGPHVGDLDGIESVDVLTEAVERMCRFLRVTPEVIAHDLHPAYASTLWAEARPERRRVAVQHHHAHVASAMAEHGLEGPVIGLAFDGTGYGPDGAAWGCEVLRADFKGYDRIATLRPIPLAGGEQAIRQPWRITLALLDDAFGGEAPIDDLRLFTGIDPAHVRVARQMATRRINAPHAHGLGRLFDGVGALVLGRPRSAFEGQLATEWNLAAAPGAHGRYPFDVDLRAQPWVLDPRPMLRAIAADLRAGRPAAEISAAFHDTIADAAAALAIGAGERYGRLPVVLTGGCFQNARLAESVHTALTGRFDVFLHGEVPPGDGGLALGQALVADAVTR
jgi:hydrogenase maturation protein HypF